MCNCIDEINAKLKELGKNTQLDIPITWNVSGQLDGSRVQIATRKLDGSKREKPVPILPSYCPFCGVAYSDAAQQSVQRTAEERRLCSERIAYQRSIGLK